MANDDYSPLSFSTAILNSTLPIPNSIDALEQSSWQWPSKISNTMEWSAQFFQPAYSLAAASGALTANNDGEYIEPGNGASSQQGWIPRDVN